MFGVDAAEREYAPELFIFLSISFKDLMGRSDYPQLDLCVPGPPSETTS